MLSFFAKKYNTKQFMYTEVQLEDKRALKEDRENEVMQKRRM